MAMTLSVKDPLRFDDLNAERAYDGMKAYFQSKAANLYFTLELAERWKGKVGAFAVDPGMVKTTLVAEAPLPLRIVFSILSVSPEKGAAVPLGALVSPEYDGKTGLLIGKKGPVPFPPGPDDADLRQKPWDESARLVKL
ncbi:MAG TPA: hypothetical protein VGK67_23805 [Myxococcales bacterium]